MGPGAWRLLSQGQEGYAGRRGEACSGGAYPPGRMEAGKAATVVTHMAGALRHIIVTEAAKLVSFLSPSYLSNNSSSACFY